MAYVQQQPTTFVYAQPQHFPEQHSSRYRCCCCDVATGAMVIGIIQIIGCAIALIYSFVTFLAITVAYSAFYIPSSIITIIFAVAQIIAASLMLYGISRKKHKYILPELIFEGIGLVCIVIGLIASIVIASMSGTLANELCNQSDIECNTNRYGYYNDYEVFQDTIIAFGIVLSIFFLIALAFSIWFFVVILRCYQYVKAKCEWEHSHQPTGVNVQYAYPQPGQVGYAQQQPGMAYTQQSNMAYNPQSNNMVYNPSGQPFQQQGFTKQEN